MTDKGWVDRVRQVVRVTRRMHLEPGDPGVIPSTKIGGAPWWPKGEPRPRCKPKGHPLAFMAQVSLRDIAGWESDPHLLSFHYCEACTDEGDMPWGFDIDDGSHAGYDLRLWEPSSRIETDGLGCETPSSLPTCGLSFSNIQEIPSYEDMAEELQANAPKGYPAFEDDLDEKAFPGLVHVQRSKIGGWPSWAQNAEWPKCTETVRMDFVGQIDWEVGKKASWGGGGYAYLFVCPLACLDRRAELLIQTT